MEDENLVWQGRPSQWTNLGVYVVCALTCWAIVPILYAGWCYLVTRCTRYEVTTERLSVETGVLSKRVEELELYRVKDTAFDQPFLLRLVGLGNVILRSSDRSDPELMLRALREGRQLRENIRGATEKMREQKRVRELDI
jgi:uncharacterized membrane protein YdbT with pleckstrin-like domain